MRNRKVLGFVQIFLATLLFMSAGVLRAENWPQWRGPHYDGSSSEEKLPSDFSRTEGVKWVAKLPGPSAATPIIWGDHVFVNSTDTASKTLRALAFDRKTGQPLWNVEVAQGFNRDDKSNLASPSPVTDGKLVYFYYGTGDLAAFDFKSKKIWSRNIEKDYGQFAMQWTYSTSPTLVGDKLYIQVLIRDEPVHGRGTRGGESYLLALDANTGKEIWKHVRPCDAAQESHEAFSTPIPISGGPSGPDLKLLIVGGDCLTAHDAKTGEELWRWGTWNPTKIGSWRLVPSAVVGGGVALVCTPKLGIPTSPASFAIKLGGRGKLDDSAIAWKSEAREIGSDVSTPLFYKGKFYVLNSDKKILSRVDPTTGKTEWTGDLGTRVKLEASPTGADGKIYCMNFRAEVFIVEASDKFNLLRTIPMGGETDDENLRSSIAVSQGNLFIRTGSKLYCVGK
jgi:outer membrane protein assembly factor BamB